MITTLVFWLQHWFSDHNICYMIYSIVSLITAFVIWYSIVSLIKVLFFWWQRSFSDYSICSMIYSVGFMITAFVFWLQHFFFDYNAVSLITTGCARTLWIRYLGIIMKIPICLTLDTLKTFKYGRVQIWIVCAYTLYSIQYKYANLPMCDIFIWGRISPMLDFHIF